MVDRLQPGATTYILGPPTASITYEPKDDITGAEFALLTEHLVGKPMTDAAWKALGAAQRHLKRVDG